MTIGIYSLKFEGTSKLYIGQSYNIERRYTTHLYSLKNSNSSKKLQYAYDTYGIPKLTILIECPKEELNILENLAIDIFDSVSNGYNTNSEAGYVIVPCGERASNSLYTKDKYLEVLELLVNGLYSHKIIEQISGVSISVIRSISSLNNHKWLKEASPHLYEKLEIKAHNFIPGSQRSASSLNITYPIIVSPDGVEYLVSNIREFSKAHGLASSNLEQLLNGRSLQCKGWVRKGNKIPSPIILISPLGIRYEIPYRGTRKFALNNNLSTGQLSLLINSKIDSYKGWKLE